MYIYKLIKNFNKFKQCLEVFASLYKIIDIKDCNANNILL